MRYPTDWTAVVTTPADSRPSLIAYYPTRAADRRLPALSDPAFNYVRAYLGLEEDGEHLHAFLTTEDLRACVRKRANRIKAADASCPAWGPAVSLRFRIPRSQLPTPARWRAVKPTTVARALASVWETDSPAELSRRIYKDTTCGAWASVAFLRADGTVEVCHSGRDGQRTTWAEREAAGDRVIWIQVGSIVEGSDAEVTMDPEPVSPTGTLEARLLSVLDEVESEADVLWHEANDPDDEEVA